MSKIKTKESVKDIKVLDKAAVASERMKTALVRSKDQMQNLMDDGQVSPSEYGIVYTVEGNSGDSCRQCHRAVGNYEILGYGVLVP